MKCLPKIYILIFIFLFLLIAGFPPAQILAAPAADQVVFVLSKENTTSGTGQAIHKVTFGIEKGSGAVPVCLTTTIEYNLNVFSLFTEADLSPSSAANSINKDVTPNLSKNSQGIIKVGVGVEDYNDTPLPDGDLFTINFKVKSGATPSADDVFITHDISEGPNQASNSGATLLKVADESGEIFDSTLDVADSGSSSGSKGSCFIGSLIGLHK
ncbi:MAG: hypothetical protein AB1847_14585 [bacterium]